MLKKLIGLSVILLVIKIFIAHFLKLRNDEILPSKSGKPQIVVKES